MLDGFLSLYVAAAWYVDVLVACVVASLADAPSSATIYGASLLWVPPLEIISLRVSLSLSLSCCSC